jgi:NAD(P)-dependent dehydrogenase (short-subunit alcohol dehydrogenase family)
MVATNGKVRQQRDAAPRHAAAAPAWGQLDGQVALVTGGGGGLGTAICRALAAAGATVVAADLRVELAERVANELSEDGRQALALPLDVGDHAQAEEAVRRTLDACGRLDILVNNAGIDVTLPIDELSVAEIERVLAVNLHGPFLIAKAAWPQLRANGGQIVNIVSTAGKRAWGNASAYHASKWGLLGLSHALHVEGRACGIRVTAIVAGGMRTPFLLDRFPEIDPDTLQEPANVARAVLFALTQPEGTVVPELTVLPLRESSWP